MEKQAEPVVLEAPEAVAGALDLLDQQVEALGWAVAGAGVVMGEDLGPPRLEGRAERVDLLDVVGRAPGYGLVDERGRDGGIVGEVDVASRFLGQPRAEEKKEERTTPRGLVCLMDVRRRNGRPKSDLRSRGMCPQQTGVHRKPLPSTDSPTARSSPPAPTWRASACLGPRGLRAPAGVRHATRARPRASPSSSRALGGLTGGPKKVPRC
jgi:hypothetical protein